MSYFFLFFFRFAKSENVCSFFRSSSIGSLPFLSTKTVALSMKLKSCIAQSLDLHLKLLKSA